jgi:hypothetical protein
MALTFLPLVRAKFDGRGMHGEAGFEGVLQIIGVIGGNLLVILEVDSVTPGATTFDRQPRRAELVADNLGCTGGYASVFFRRPPG